MLEVKNLCKTYRPRRGVAVKALQDISIRFPEKGMVFLLGRSGSGKSTLLNLLGGLDRYDSGDIILDGVSTKDFSQADYDSYRNACMGFVFQEYNVLPEFTVGVNIAIALELQGKKATSEEIAAILDEVDLTGYAKRRPNELSGGQLQRVAIARALVKNPKIILADEPTGALDSTTSRQVFDTLRKLAETKLVIIVSHDREYSEQYADRIIELADGQIISDVSRTAVNTENFSKKPMLTDGVCRVLGGYELTPQDFEDINRYIAEHPTESLRIRVDDNLTRGFAFEPTAQQPDDTGKNLFEKIRSKLPMLRAARIGITGLKSKKIRLVFTVIMSVVAFSLFGLASTLADYDYVKTVSKVFVEENVSNVYVKAETQRTYVIARTYDNNDPITRSVWTEKSANEQDFDLLRSQTGISVEPVYNIADLTVSYTSEDKDDDSLLSMLQLGSLDKWIEVDEKVLADYGCMLKVGKLPDGEKNEVAISLVAYDMIRNSALLNGTKIPKMTDMVGKQYTVSDGTVLTVTGIIDTGLNYMSYVTRRTELLGNNGKGNGRALISWNQIWGLVLAQDFVYDLESNLASCNMVGKGYVQRQPLSKLTVDDRNVRVAVGDDSERYGLNIMF